MSAAGPISCSRESIQGCIPDLEEKAGTLGGGKQTPSGSAWPDRSVSPSRTALGPRRDMSFDSTSASRRMSRSAMRCSMLDLAEPDLVDVLYH